MLFRLNRRADWSAASIVFMSLYGDREKATVLHIVILEIMGRCSQALLLRSPAAEHLKDVASTWSNSIGAVRTFWEERSYSFDWSLSSGYSTNNLSYWSLGGLPWILKAVFFECDFSVRRSVGLDVQLWCSSSPYWRKIKVILFKRLWFCV